MRENLGGVAYDASAHLRFGAPDRRLAFAASNAATPPVELHLRRSSGKNEEDEGENASEAEKEARMVGRRLLEQSGIKRRYLTAMPRVLWLGATW